MNTFRLIAGSGHCGSQWLVIVLTGQKDVIAYHELRRRLQPGKWPDVIDRAPESTDAYFEQIRADLEHSHVVDGISWGLYDIPLVHEIQPVTEVIYLVRNPIQQMHSLWTASDAWRNLPEDHYAYDVWLRNLYEIAPRPPLYDERDRFGKMCELVRANVYGPQWIAQHGIPVTVYRLEDITTDVALVAQIAPRLTLEDILMWMDIDINRKVWGNRDPEYLWSLWSDSMRRVFEHLCAASMNRYGYKWPEGVVA